MEIVITEIKEKNIKAIKRYLRKWRVRRNGGATVLDIIFECKLSATIVEPTLDWMFRDGKVAKVQEMNGLEVRYVG